MRFWCLLFLSLLVSSLTGAKDHDVGATNTDIEEADEKLMHDEIKDDLNKIRIINFDWFQKNFGRVYSSPVETVMRQAVYLANTVKIFVQNLLFRKKSSLHYLSVTPLADYTEEELRQLYSIPDRPRVEKHEELDDDDDEDGDGDEPGKSTTGEEEFGDRNVIGHKSKRNGLIDDSMEEKDGDQERRIKRSPDSLEELLLKERQKFDDIRWTPSSFYPHHDIPNIIHNSFKKYNKTDDESSESSSQKKGFLDKFAGVINYLIREKPRVDVDQFRGMPDQMFINWRHLNCLSPVRSQEKCGSCWAFALIANLEFEYCRQSGRLIQLSPQYLIDCGDEFSRWWDGINACGGAHMDSIDNFVKKAGVIQSCDYPYRAKEGKCPYDKSDPEFPRIIPSIKKSDYWGNKAYDSIDSILSQGPVLISMHVSNDFHLYKGGIHTNIKYKAYGGHSMLIVGDGIEDGHPFWLIRNSHGRFWGENGYYKLSKNAPKRSAIGVHQLTIKYENKFGSMCSRPLKFIPSKRSSLSAKSLLTG